MKLKYQFIIQQLLDEYIAIEAGNATEDFQGVITLNETGKDIFMYIQEGLDKSAIIDAMLQEYEGVTPEILSNEIDAIVAKLKAEDLIVE